MKKLTDHSHEIAPAISAGYAFIMADLNSESPGPIQNFLARNRELLANANISLYTASRD